MPLHDNFYNINHKTPIKKNKNTLNVFSISWNSAHFCKYVNLFFFHSELMQLVGSRPILCYILYLIIPKFSFIDNISKINENIGN